jgi:hypothetical protein
MMTKRDHSQPTVGCLFAAIGGFARAFQEAGAIISWANEKDRFATDTFRLNFPHIRCVEFDYEKPLSLGGSTRYPDFTIDDQISGRIVFWEHLGMLEREDYRRSWEKKLKWYRSQRVLPVDEGAGPNGMLVTTSESSAAGFDSPAVQVVIRKYLKG